MTKMERRSLGASFYICRMREYAFRGRGDLEYLRIIENNELNFI